MHIEHFALWTSDLERLKTFYEHYFHAHAGSLYTNPRTQFQSYFLSFDNGPRLEIMHMPGIPPSLDDIEKQFTGYIHLAISVGDKQTVDTLTAQLAADGYRVMSAPRTTGDGYYESVILDPDGNRIEITA